MFLTPVERRLRRPDADRLERSRHRAAVPADAGHAEPAHHRRHIPLRRSEAQSRRWRRIRSSISSRTSAAGQWSAIVPRQLLRFFGVPQGHAAIELVEPTARRTIGLVMSDREPPSPLARNLFAMQWPADIAALIEPPNRGRIEAIELSYQFFRTFNLPDTLPQAHHRSVSGGSRWPQGGVRCRAGARADRPQAVDAGGGAADPARSPASVRLYRRRGRRADGRRAQHLEGRGARRRQLLSRLPPQPGRRAGAEALPGGIVPGDGMRRPRRPSRERATALSPDDRGAGAGLHVETVYCLGNCALSPAALLDGEPIGRLDRDRLDAIVAEREGTNAVSARVFVPSRFRGPFGRRRRRRRGAGARGARPRHRALDRAHRLARPLLAGAAGRGRDAGRARRLRAGRRRGRCARCSTPGSWPAARIPRRSAASRTSPISPRQQRLVFARCGVTDPLSLDDYRRHGGLEGLERGARTRARTRSSTRSWPRACAAAAAPAFRPAIKWRTVAGAEADQKYVVCNADEGDSGTFADRMLMEGDPFLLIEGMAIAAVAVGATMGYVYIRSEYPHAFATFSRAIERARAAGLLGRERARLGPRLRHRGPARRRRLYLRRGDLAAREPRGQARRRCAPSRRCRRSRACSASRRSSTTC